MNSHPLQIMILTLGFFKNIFCGRSSMLCYFYWSELGYRWCLTYNIYIIFIYLFVYLIVLCIFMSHVCDLESTYLVLMCDLFIPNMLNIYCSFQISFVFFCLFINTFTSMVCLCRSWLQFTKSLQKNGYFVLLILYILLLCV